MKLHSWTQGKDYWYCGNCYVTHPIDEGRPALSGCDKRKRQANLRHRREQEQKQSTIYTTSDDLPLFTGQCIESSKYDARGYQPKEYHRQLDIFKENQA